MPFPFTLRSTNKRLRKSTNDYIAENNKKSKPNDQIIPYNPQGHIRRQPIEQISIGPTGDMQDTTNNEENQQDPDGDEPMRLMSSIVSNAMGNRVTPITEPPPNISWGLPETWNCKHTAIYQNNFGWNLNDDNERGTSIQTKDFRIKLNSIKDVNPFSGSDQVPAWRNFFATFYDYYTVLKCELHLTFNYRGLNNSTSDPDNGIAIGWEQPPSDWMIFYRDFGDTSYGTIGTDAAWDWKKMLKDPQIKVAHLKLQPMGTSTIPTASIPVVTTGLYNQMYKGTLSLDFEFTHKDYTHLMDIVQDGNDKIWIPKANDADLNHYLWIMPRRKYAIKNPAGSGDTIEWMTVDLRQVWTVQWKQLNSTYAFSNDTFTVSAASYS